MNKNVLIVNFNTQELTDACIKSVNMKVPGCSIYVFDNSDKEPFVNTFSNVTIFDNTKGEIINFEKWLEQYPKNKRSPEATKIRGSAKHCYTIEKCMELIPDGFVLLDSDVLVKKDFSELYDEKLIYIAETHKQNGVNVIRVLPFICWINSKMCKENNVHFFDETKMLGLYVTPKGEQFDTGAAFYLNAKNFPHKEIRYEEYIVHLKGGSWFETHKNFTKRARKIDIKITPETWLKQYQYLWDENFTGEINVEEVNQNKEKPPVIIKDFKKKKEEQPVCIQEKENVTQEVSDKKRLEVKFAPKKTTIEEDKRVVFKRPVHKQQTEHATLLSQVKKSTLTGRKIALIKRK